MIDSRFIIGIDLGTTNIAVTYIDTENSPDSIQNFAIKQLVAPGEVHEAELLPSFCYLPDQKLLPDNALKLPWQSSQNHAVGIFARDGGSEVPNRFINSAKSWLCHAGVNRKDRILPWLGEVKDYSKSPVEITEFYLQHIKAAWDAKFKRHKDSDGNPCIFESQQVTITVPASFDQMARELTLEAAENAGYKNINLLEEPLSVFYAWLSKHNLGWQDTIGATERILVIDIGGGTCDFSLIETDENRTLKRTATGEHLLLGGDNIDMALAKQVETGWQTNLSQGAWSSLVQKTREAKEKILSSGTDSVEVVLLSKGSSLIGNMRKADITRNQVEELLLDGFFPIVTADEPPPRRKGTIQTMGLPYEPDPAVSRHLLDFLKRAAKVTEADTDILCPDKILFNGGTVLADVIRNRVFEIVGNWFPEQKADIAILDAGDLQLAVAIGASYYGRTRRGDGVKVKSGTAHAYFVEVAEQEKRKYICVMPRGIDENVRIETPGTFHLEANQKVEFPLYSSSTRLGDKPGDVIDFDEELVQISSLINVIRFGKQDKKQVETEIAAQITETGVLHLWLEALQTEHKWPLKFDVRLLADNQQKQDSDDVDIIIESEKVTEACDMIRNAFGNDSDQLPSLLKNLEKQFDMPRQKWPLPLLRELADCLLDIPYQTLQTNQKEHRWLNLCGFALRPGFGDPADNLRLKKVWQLWFKGMNHPNNPQVVAEWWVFWRRVASGLGPGHQNNIFQKLFKVLCPKGEYGQKVKNGPQAKAEMWRCLGALELITPKSKVTTGNILALRVKKLEPYEFWVLARLGTRRLFNAPVNHVISSQAAEKWLKIILAAIHKNSVPFTYFALSRIAALSGDRNLDISKPMLEKVSKKLEAGNVNQLWIKHLEIIEEETPDEQAKILGDSLPLGLKLVK